MRRRGMHDIGHSPKDSAVKTAADYAAQMNARHRSQPAGRRGKTAANYAAQREK